MAPVCKHGAADRGAASAGGMGKNCGSREIGNEEAGHGKISVEPGARAAVADHGALRRSWTTLSGLWTGIQEKKLSLGGSKAHPLWYADLGREANKETVCQEDRERTHLVLYWFAAERQGESAGVGRPGLGHHATAHRCAGLGNAAL